MGTGPRRAGARGTSTRAGRVGRIAASIAAGVGAGAVLLVLAANLLGVAGRARGVAGQPDPAARTASASQRATQPAPPRLSTPARSPAAAREPAGPPSLPAPAEAGPSARTGRASAAAPLRGVVVALDPGHNGANARHLAQINRPVDAGGFRKACNTTGTATNAGYPEAQFTWELSTRLAGLLTARGAVVRRTRPDNAGWGPCVDARGRFGARVHAAVLVSLHGDGAPAGGSGFHVIVPAYRPGYTDDILPASAGLGRTLRDGLVSAGFRPSTYIGRSGLDTRPDLGTLNLADVPAVLVECGNMRNGGDAAVMRSAAGQQRMALALADALTRYLHR